MSGPGILVGLWLGMRVCCQVGDEDKTGAWEWKLSVGCWPAGRGACVGRPGANWEGGAGLPLGPAQAALGPSEPRE